MSIVLDQVTKRYQAQAVVNDVSLDVNDGEFLVLLGPSGSGKSTLLRAIAGLTEIDHGRVSLHGRDVTHTNVRQREVGFVFQHYALFRHMSVGENIEFALRVRRVPAAERVERREELLRLVALEGMGDRLPTQLSGGQQQRVAVARALAHRPKVLLMDEPFGALDAKIREELRRTIRGIQRELGITTILVTHDQEEAFALADRIGVMHQGRLLECGKPDDLYTRPQTRFVATFLGAANLLLGYRTGNGMQFSEPDAHAHPAQPPSQEFVAVLRPEEIELAGEVASVRSTPVGHARVEEVLFGGAVERLRVRMLDGGSVASAAAAPQGGNEPGTVLEVTRTLPEKRVLPVAPGQRIAVGARRVHVLPTPVSSFCVVGTTEEECARLSDLPLLQLLASRMQTRVRRRLVPGLAPGDGSALNVAAPPGVAIVESGTHGPSRVAWLLTNGSLQLCALPREAPMPTRVLIATMADEARRATLAVAASLLRHVPAEAVLLGVQSEAVPDAERPEHLRGLLNARSEASALHGLDLRTELKFGDLGTELERELATDQPTLLVIGVPYGSPAATADVVGSLAPMLGDGARHSVMLVRTRAELA
jgi:sulfate transport system ATP-binding protein